MQHQLPFVFSVLFATHANVSMKNTRYALHGGACMLHVDAQCSVHDAVHVRSPSFMKSFS